MRSSREGGREKAEACGAASVSRRRGYKRGRFGVGDERAARGRRDSRRTPRACFLFKVFKESSETEEYERIDRSMGDRRRRARRGDRVVHARAPAAAPWADRLSLSLSLSCAHAPSPSPAAGDRKKLPRTQYLLKEFQCKNKLSIYLHVVGRADVPCRHAASEAGTPPTRTERLRDVRKHTRACASPSYSFTLPFSLKLRASIIIIFIENVYPIDRTKFELASPCLAIVSPSPRPSPDLCRSIGVFF